MRRFEEKGSHILSSSMGLGRDLYCESFKLQFSRARYKKKTDCYYEFKVELLIEIISFEIISFEIRVEFVLNIRNSFK